MTRDEFILELIDVHDVPTDDARFLADLVDGEGLFDRPVSRADLSVLLEGHDRLGDAPAHDVIARVPGIRWRP